jgi:hypothetical protein
VNDEQLDNLTREISAEIEQMSSDAAKPLTRQERKHKLVLRARRQALDRMKEAKGKGDINQEVKANLDYALLTDYGEKNIFLYNFMKARLYWWRGI